MGPSFICQICLFSLVSCFDCPSTYCFVTIRPCVFLKSDVVWLASPPTPPKKEKQNKNKKKVILFGCLPSRLVSQLTPRCYWSMPAFYSQSDCVLPLELFRDADVASSSTLNKQQRRCLSPLHFFFFVLSSNFSLRKIFQLKSSESAKGKAKSSRRLKNPKALIYGNR